MRVFVLSSTKKQLMPCHQARARKLLFTGKAAVFRTFPFTVILKNREDGDVQEVELKVDPGSKTTGIALVVHGKNRKKMVLAANLEHRGNAIKKRLEQRRGVRRARRHRNLRYRAPRFQNRTRRGGWLAPSLLWRVHNVTTWANRFQKFTPLSHVAVETVRFDMQKIQNPEISGVEYQHGELLGYEVREYLLEKWQRKCTYCLKENIPLQIEHIVPRSKGGSNRVSNLCLACEKCNQKKGSRDLNDFLKNQPELLHKITLKMRQSLKDAAAVNATRFATGHALKTLNLPTSFWSGGRTKFNRLSQGYKKDHWLDAACVGKSGRKISLPNKVKILLIKAQGHGDRQACLVDKHGFPRSKPAGSKQVHGFQTGDYVIATVLKGKKRGIYKGKVAVRSSGSFNISTAKEVVQGISYRSCSKIHSADGYHYSFKECICLV